MQAHVDAVQQYHATSIITSSVICSPHVTSLLSRKMLCQTIQYIRRVLTYCCSHLYTFVDTASLEAKCRFCAVTCRGEPTSYPQVIHKGSVLREAMSEVDVITAFTRRSIKP